MESRTLQPVSMLRFVLAFLIVKLAAAGALIAYVYSTDSEPPISSTLILIAAVGAAVFWFAKAINRPMLKAEILRFSLGNCIAELALTFAWGIGMIWLLDVPVSWEGLSIVMDGGGDPDVAKFAFMTGLTVGLVQVLAFSALFRWLMTKSLPIEAIANK